MMKRVHIFLSPQFRAAIDAQPPREAETLLRGLSDRLNLSAPNLERAARFGVLSADAPEEMLPHLREETEIDDFEEDGTKSAL